LTHNYIRSKNDYAGLFLHTLFKGLALKGHKITVLAPHQKGLSISEKTDGVKIFRFRYAPSFLENLAYGGEMQKKVMGNPLNIILFLLFLFSFFSCSYKLTRKKEVDLISCQWWIPGGLIGWLVFYFTKKPFWITLHGTDLRILKSSNIFKPLARKVLKKAKGVSCVSSFLKDYLVQSGLVKNDKVKVMPMPVDTQKFRRQRLMSKNEKTLLCVARFTRQKGLDYLIQAIKILFDKGFDFKTKIIGGGPERKNLEKKIQELGLSEKVLLLDSIPSEKIFSHYQESDLFVLPSIEEGFGLVLVEAQLCGRPVIGTNSGGIPDIIEDNVTGLLVKPQDPVDLAKAIERILVDPELAEKLAEQGFQSAISKFSHEAIQEKFMEFINLES
jgi:glycosyltransferase involved in cell wall biosynthesis